MNTYAFVIQLCDVILTRNNVIEQEHETRQDALDHAQELFDANPIVKSIVVWHEGQIIGRVEAATVENPTIDEILAAPQHTEPLSEGWPQITADDLRDYQGRGHDYSGPWGYLADAQREIDDEEDRREWGRG